LRAGPYAQHGEVPVIAGEQEARRQQGGQRNSREVIGVTAADFQGARIGFSQRRGKPVPLEYSIEWMTCAFASRLDVVMVSLPGAA